MKARFVLSPEAAADLAEIWNYIKEQTSLTMADRVVSAIRERMVFLSRSLGAGHRRADLTEEEVKFFPIYSYLIVYRAETNPSRSSPFSMAAATWEKFWIAACESGTKDAR